MLVPMVKVHVIGHRRRLRQTLAALHHMATIQLIDVTEDASVTLPPLAADENQLSEIEGLRYLRARIDALLSLTSSPPTASTASVELADIKHDVEAAAPDLERQARTIDELEAELETLPRHMGSLKRLMPLVPELTDLAGYDTDAVILDSRHAAVIGDLNSALEGLLDGNFEVIAGQVDTDTIGAIIVTPKWAKSEVRSLLGLRQVSRVRLPRRFESVPFKEAITLMEHRLIEIRVEIAGMRDRLTAGIRSHEDWAAALDLIDERLEQLAAIGQLGATPHTFVVSGWLPTNRLEDVRRVVADLGEGEVIVELAPIDRDEQPPVLMVNRSIARPFESLVSLLSTPRYGSLDPSTLMMIFFPLFFGMMLGDVVYGAVLLGVAILVRRRLRVRSPSVAEISKVFILAAVWTILWGVVYGEALGDLGHRVLDFEPIWINREEALEPLLIFAIAVGAAHITLGLLLGVWEAGKQRDAKRLSTSIGSLLAIVGLFLIVGVASDQLPSGVMSPAVAVIVIGTVLMMAFEGPMGLLTGPLELVGTIGNILSYLRIAAIGIASVYLARVANELGSLGPLWLGIIVAALFHALNLALGVFSPTIQALRLHYVEFFGKFYEGGGSAFHPFGLIDRKE